MQQPIQWLSRLIVFSALALTLFISVATFAADAEITIFDMRKTLALSDSDVVYRDFYVSRGAEAGLRPGQIITVKRRMPLYDAFHNRSAGDLSVSVGRVKIIHVERDLAVAREHSQFSRDDLPLLEDAFIMVGDELDLSSATTENKVKDKKATRDEPRPEAAEKQPDTAAKREFSVDFASKAPDKTTAAEPIEGPVVQ
jgi:hypothetical protein